MIWFWFNLSCTSKNLILFVSTFKTMILGRSGVSNLTPKTNWFISRIMRSSAVQLTHMTKKKGFDSFHIFYFTFFFFLFFFTFSFICLNVNIHVSIVDIYIYIYIWNSRYKCERIFSSKYEKLTIGHLNFQNLWSLKTQDISLYN